VNDPQPEETRRIATALRTAIRLSGISHRQVERELGLSTGYLTRILAGQVQLRVTHVLGVCHIIGLPPASFFAALYPPTPPATVAEARLVRGLAQLHPNPGQASEAENLLNALRAFVEELKGQFPEKE
jgi:transcriptional regulator with XRE-family HTH domain